MLYSYLRLAKENVDQKFVMFIFLKRSQFYITIYVMNANATANHLVMGQKRISKFDR